MISITVLFNSHFETFFISVCQLVNSFVCFLPNSNHACK